MHNDDAFLLLSLPSATLERQRERPVTDSLYLECVTAPDREMYLVIKLGYVQVAVDPHRRVIRSIKRDSHFYSFLSTDSDSQFSLSIPLSQDPVASQDLETFNHILTQYLTGFSQERVPPLLPHLNSVDGLEYEDLRGHLVLVNESDGSVLGDLDHQFKISEDSALFRNLPEDAPVLIELPPDYDSATSVRTKVPGQEFVPFAARQAFVRAVPPEERDALTNTATLISHAISATTTLLVSGMSAASKYYVAHSKPQTPDTSPGPSHGISINSPRTRLALTQAHVVSGKAVKVSSKTLEVVDGLVKKAVGRKEKMKPRNPPSQEVKQSLTPSSNFSDPGLHPPQPTLRKKDKIILSAEVVLATIEESINRLLDVSSEEITRVVTHKRGEESGQNAALATGTVRNVALVYVDSRGFARKAIVRRIGKEYTKTKLSSGNSNRPRLDQIIAEHTSQHQSPSNVHTISTLKPPPPPRHPYERK